MKRLVMVLLFSIGLMVLARVSSIAPQAHACTEDGGDSDDDGDDGNG